MTIMFIIPLIAIANILEVIDIQEKPFLLEMSLECENYSPIYFSKCLEVNLP